MGKMRGKVLMIDDLTIKTAEEGKKTSKKKKKKEVNMIVMIMRQIR